MEYTKEINKIVEGINFVNKTVKPTKKYKKVCEYCGKEFETCLLYTSDAADE